MDLVTNIKESMRNLLSSKLRSFLAILGVLVGTGSVVALISSSQLATANALAQFKALGTNLLAMTIQNKTGSTYSKQAKDLVLSDMPILLRSSKQVVEIAPYISVFQSIIFHDQKFDGQILGATENFEDIAKIRMTEGRFVSFLDRHQYYCVIGHDIANQIRAKFGNPLHKQIQLGNFVFTIIGIADNWPTNFFIFADINNSVIIPLQTSYLLSSGVQISNVLFRLIQKPDLVLAQQQLQIAAENLVPSKQIQFRNPGQIIDIVGKQRQTFTWLLAAIGGISLLVGGIGVMNIMLVSVVERRREIGIRMAIGARRSNILGMFLIESVILTIFGGLIGILIGVLVSYLLAVFTGWEFQLYLLPPTLGFVVSVIVGIISGYYPAWRASRLDPIKTLQSD